MRALWALAEPVRPEVWLNPFCSRVDEGYSPFASQTLGQLSSPDQVRARFCCPKAQTQQCFELVASEGTVVDLCCSGGHELSPHAKCLSVFASRFKTCHCCERASNGHVEGFHSLPAAAQGNLEAKGIQILASQLALVFIGLLLAGACSQAAIDHAVGRSVFKRDVAPLNILTQAWKRGRRHSPTSNFRHRWWFQYPALAFVCPKKMTTDPTSAI